MRRKLISLILVYTITGCLFSGCGSVKEAMPEKNEEVKTETDETQEVKSETDEPQEANPKSEEKLEEKSDEKPETETVDDTDHEASYAPVFDEVLKVVTTGYDFDKEYNYISDGLMEKCMYPGDGELSETVGYVLEDISGDGIPELVIGCDENYSDVGLQSYIYSVFTLQNDKPLKVFDGWARSSYRWMGNNHFYYCGSGGAAITLFGENHLSKDGTEIIWDDFYFSDEKEMGVIGLYHNNSGVFDAGESEELDIPQDKFWSKMDDYESQCKQLSWTPIGKYQEK